MSVVTEEAYDTWNATMPRHLIIGLDWSRYDNGMIVWSWRCICGGKGSAQNDHVGSALWSHLAEK